MHSLLGRFGLVQVNQCGAPVLFGVAPCAERWRDEPDSSPPGGL